MIFEMISKIPEKLEEELNDALKAKNKSQIQDAK